MFSAGFAENNRQCIVFFKKNAILKKGDATHRPFLLKTPGFYSFEPGVAFLFTAPKAFGFHGE
jgi:hypothetical protein